jgi:hypothetical protein
VSRRQAIDIALDALAKPEVTSFLSVGPLPEGLKVVLRIVAEGEWRDAATEHVYSKHSAETVRAASAAFLATVLFGRKTDPYRALGLPPGASLGEVREHKRLLLKWLHPDRNPEATEQAHLAKVIAAAEAIEGGRGEHVDGSGDRSGDAQQARRMRARAPRPQKAAPARNAMQRQGQSAAHGAVHGATHGAATGAATGAALGGSRARPVRPSPARSQACCARPKSPPWLSLACSAASSSGAI